MSRDCWRRGRSVSLSKPALQGGDPVCLILDHSGSPCRQHGGGHKGDALLGGFRPKDALTAEAQHYAGSNVKGSEDKCTDGKAEEMAVVHGVPVLGRATGSTGLCNETVPPRIVSCQDEAFFFRRSGFVSSGKQDGSRP